MKNIFNNKKIYIIAIIIITVLYIFLMYGGIQKGITKTVEYNDNDDHFPIMETVMICILIVLLTISLTLVPIKIRKTMWRGGTIQNYKYNSLLLNKTYHTDEKWPFMKNISY